MSRITDMSTKNFARAAARSELKEMMYDSLHTTGWKCTEIKAYLMAQESHGILRPGIEAWRIRSSMRTWIKDVPRSRPNIYL